MSTHRSDYQDETAPKAAAAGLHPWSKAIGRDGHNQSAAIDGVFPVHGLATGHAEGAAVMVAAGE
jgi:hypothetical protein